MDWWAFLWHFPVILLLSNGKKSSWWLMLIEVLFTFLFAALSYHYIETPIRYGTIRKNIAIIRRRVRTKGERKNQVRVLKRCLLIGLGVCHRNRNDTVYYICTKRKGAKSYWQFGIPSRESWKIQGRTCFGTERNKRAERGNCYIRWGNSEKFFRLESMMG